MSLLTLHPDRSRCTLMRRLCSPGMRRKQPSWKSATLSYIHSIYILGFIGVQLVNPLCFFHVFHGCWCNVRRTSDWPSWTSPGSWIVWAASSVGCGGNCRRGPKLSTLETLFGFNFWFHTALCCNVLLIYISLPYHQTQGLGTSLKILFSQRQIEALPGSGGLQRPRFQLSRQEIVSLLNAFGRWDDLPWSFCAVC